MPRDEQPLLGQSRQALLLLMWLFQQRTCLSGCSPAQGSVAKQADTRVQLSMPAWQSCASSKLGHGQMTSGNEERHFVIVQSNR